jgi:predicted  nucleic acid-binding Zn-ribbon protein
MQEQINYLIQLQQIDKTIHHIHLSVEENPKKIELIDKETHGVQETFQAFTKEMDEIQKQRRDLEREVEEVGQKIKKSQVKLMEVKTNKEYRAMLSEIDELKKVKTAKEDLLLDLMEKLEKGVEKQKTLAKSVEAKMAEGKQKKEHLKAESLEYEKELFGQNQKRKDLSTRVDPALLKQYEFLKNRLRGMAVAEVKEYACLGCNMQIPPQLFNELHRQDRIITCPSCLRILYITGPSELKEK